MNAAAQATPAIDRASPEPFYLQLGRFISEAIERGEFTAGDRLPGESELCRRYDLARSTVRETLRLLEERKLIRLVPRRGAFVAGPGESGWVLQGPEGFFEAETGQNQRKVETAVLEAKRKTLPDAPHQALGLKSGENGFVLRRLRRLDGKLALYSVNYLPADLGEAVAASPALEPDGSLNRALAEAGHRIIGARRSVEAVAAPAAVAKLLEVSAGAPLLLVTSLSWAKGGRKVDYYQSWVRSEIVKVSVEAHATGEQD